MTFFAGLISTAKDLVAGPIPRIAEEIPKVPVDETEGMIGRMKNDESGEDVQDGLERLLFGHGSSFLPFRHRRFHSSYFKACGEFPSSPLLPNFEHKGPVFFISIQDMAQQPVPQKFQRA